MARVSGCMQKPRPRPKNTAITPGTHRPVSTPRDRPMTTAAAVRMAVPMMGKIR
jgi:hypothetical protein